MTAEEKARCPMLPWAVSLVLSIIALDVLFRVTSSERLSPLIPVVAVGISAIVLETLLRRGWYCESFDGPLRRTIIYVISWPIAIFIWSGVTVELVMPAVRYRVIVILLFVIPLLALSFAHSWPRLDRIARIFVAIPALVLACAIAIVLFFAVTNFTAK